MQKIPTSQANRYSTGQEIPRLSRYLNVHYRVHKSLRLDPIQSRITHIPFLHDKFQYGPPMYIRVPQLFCILQTFPLKHAIHLSALL
jgi:hypothetical protein